MANFGTYFTDVSYEDIWNNPEKIRKDVLDFKVVVFKNIKTNLENKSNNEA